mmetsp:Transcript_28530/g.47937  ORF Transcript_28530/g.47937 Transcript_28530/m.47937 type:complete len:274 (-) Transcript_28530:92-913(-)
MFQLCILEDKIKTQPGQFNRDTEEVLREQIEMKYSNKVLNNVGLCITFYDFISVAEPYLYPSEGSAIQLVKFRMVVFRPFIGEILTGNLKASNKEGLKISIEFFADIFVPAALLQSPCVYNKDTGLWTWKYGENGDDFVMELGEEVRFRVRTINFTSLSNSAKGIMATTTSESQDSVITAAASNSIPVGGSGGVSGGENNSSSSSSHGGSGGSSSNSGSATTTTTSTITIMPGPPLLRRRSSSIGLSPEDEMPAAMQVIGAMNDFGLGLISWW